MIANEATPEQLATFSFQNAVKRIPGSNVFLIGNTKIDPVTLRVLNNGLNFVPSLNPEETNSQEIEDLANPINRAIRKATNSQQPRVIEAPTQASNRKRRANEPVTDLLIQRAKEELSNIRANTTNKPNISPSERQAILRLQRDPNTTIKLVDKGLGIALIESSYYSKLCWKQHLADSNTYHQLEVDPLDTTIDTINKRLDNLERQNLLSKRVIDYSRPPKKKCTNGIFYILPKLHKGKLESRPIVSNVSHPTSNVSKFLHQLLLPTAKAAKSYVENSLQAARELKNLANINSNTFIITADIKSLYTNIPNDEGIKNVAEELHTSKINPTGLLNSFDSKSKITIPSFKWTTEELLKIVLENNVIEFGNEYFRQISGTAMGTAMAPSYANTYLKHKEERGNSPIINHPNLLYFKRYIDDILVIYDNSDSSLPAFIKALKEAYRPLEISVKIGKSKIPFLDLELSVCNNRIEYELYSKPICERKYIPTTSNHPRKMLENTVYNDLIRAERLCSQNQTRYKHQLAIKSDALRAGHSRKKIDQLIAKARKNESDINSTHSNPAPATEAIVRVHLTHEGETTTRLTQAIKETWKATAPPNTSLMIGSRTQKSLQRLLIRSRFKTASRK